MAGQAPQLGGYGSPGSGNFLGALGGILGSLHQANQERREEKDKSAQMKLEADQLKLNTQKTQAELAAQNVTAAQGKVEALKPVLLTDPTKRSDPAYIKSVKDSYAAQGLPAPVTTGPDGKESIDISAWQKDYTTLDPSLQKFYASMTPDVRKPYLDSLAKQGYVIPKDMYTSTQYVDAKDQIGLGRLKLAGMKEGEWAKIQEGNLSLKAQRQQYLDAGDVAKVHEIDARVQVLNAQAAAIPQKLQIEQQRVNNQLTSINNVMARFQSSPHTQRNQLLSEATKGLQVYSAVQRELDDTTKNWSNLVEQGASTDDPNVIKARELMDSVQDQLTALGQVRVQSIAALQNGTATASSVAASSGNSTTVTNPGRTPQGSGPVEGQTAVSKSGKPMVYRNGAWNYK